MWITYLRNCALCLAAFGLGAALIYPFFPTPAFMRTELDFFKEHKDEFDVLFLGSSVLRRGVIPVEFDERLGEIGHQVKSFNLAIPGMRALEVNYFLEQILALKPARLRCVILELDRFNPRIHEDNRMAPRMVFWHDLPHTLLALESIRLEQGPILKQLNAAKIHTVLHGAKLTSIGQGPELLASLRDEWLAQDNLDLQQNRGWVAFSEFDRSGVGDSKVSRNRRMLLEGEDWYASEVEALIESRASASSHAAFNFDALQQRIASTQAAGIDLVHILPPQLDLLPNIRHALQAGLIERILDYHAPKLYPEFYAIENHFDRNHLNLAGAKLWTRRLAEDMAGYLAAE